MEKALVYIFDPARAFGAGWRGMLEAMGYGVAVFRSEEQLLAAVRREPPNVILKPPRPPREDGARGLAARLAAVSPDTVTVVVQERPDVRTAIEAVRRGAFDCLGADCGRELAGKTLDRALDFQARTAAEPRLLRRIEALRPPDVLAGASRAMREVQEVVARVARTDVSVLIQGESGTGKELVARQLHERSHRRRGPFVAVNSAALADSMIESELFGHVKGAFTGAISDKPGRLALAEGGTLFLDEIGDLSPKGQADLLRVLEDRMFRPLGSRVAHRADVRFLAATHRDLEAACAAGAFREDLLYRINVITVTLPPLRERPEDIGPLALQFLQHFRARHRLPEKTLGPGVLEALCEFSWPGNVRQLRNAIEQAVLLSRGPEIRPGDLPRWMKPRAPASPAGAAPPAHFPTLAEVEAAHIGRALERCGGNRAAAARLLGIGRRTLHYKLRGLESGGGRRNPGASGEQKLPPRRDSGETRRSHALSHL